MAAKGPYRLVTVNNAPERARKLVGRVIEDVKESYTIVHAANAESKRRPKEKLGVDDVLISQIGPEAARAIFEDIRPDIVVSFWHQCMVTSHTLTVI
jgi:hypothetical protein